MPYFKLRDPLRNGLVNPKLTQETFFFKLPRDLRNQVYSYTTSLETTPFMDYAGFCMSCRQIKDEIDIEGEKTLRKRLTDIRSNLPQKSAVLFEIPSTVVEMRNVHVSLT
ncbi:hypothetical protein EK21DRAFT_78490, partial [Setomelanomma holmii]